MINKRSIPLAVAASFAFIASCLILFPSYTVNPEKGMYLDHQQEQKAFVLLNKVRQDPNSYSERFEVGLHGYAPRPALVWNDSLAVVAERKAMSMAMSGYFGHVDSKGYGINYYVNKSYPLSDDMLKKKDQSELEAIEGGAPSGEFAIKNIIKNNDNRGEDGRKLLLGVGDFNMSLNEVGIGYVHGTTSTKFRSYTVIIMAKKKGL